MTRPPRKPPRSLTAVGEAMAEDRRRLFELQSTPEDDAALADLLKPSADDDALAGLLAPTAEDAALADLLARTYGDGAAVLDLLIPDWSTPGA